PCSGTSARRTRTSTVSRRSGWSTGSSRRPSVSFRELLEKGPIAEFPALQLALGAIKGRIDRLTVASIGTGGSKEEYPLVDILGTPTSYQVKVLEDSPEYLDWLNSALLCAGFVEPIGLTAIARRLAEYEDIILGVDTNILYASILGEHLLDEFHRIHVRPYKESVNWILLVIPGVVMKELENAANMKKGNRLSHAGRRGYRALQEITTLKGTEGYQGLSVLVVGPTNPEQLHLSPDGLTIVNADSMIRDQFKAFLRGIDFRKGVFFLTMDKTNASLAAAEGLTALRIQYPRRLRKGDELAMPKEESVLLARLVYELAIEFGTVRVTRADQTRYPGACLTWRLCFSPTGVRYSIGISRNRRPARITSSLSSSQKAIPSWTSRRRDRIDRRNDHMPDWESRIPESYRLRNATFRISLPTRCMPVIVPSERPERRSPDTK